LLLDVCTGDEPFNEDDGTSVSCGMSPNALNVDSGVADADDAVDVV
jgi:hypothetical protein